MPNRLTAIQNLIIEKGLDAFIVTNPVNIFYLTGFRGISQTERESMLIVTKKNSTLIAPKLYLNEAQELKNENLNVEIVSERDQLKSAIQKILANSKKIGFEKNDLKYGEYLSIKKLQKGTKFKAAEDLVENLRAIKTLDEIAKIEKAQVISQKAFEKLIGSTSVGQTEIEIAQALEQIMKSLGADTIAFETIVATGKNSSRPHYTTGKTKIKKGDVLLFDFGAKFQDYCADLSRTIFVGSPSSEQRNIYKHVQNAQNAAIASISAKSKTHDPYHAANNHFKNLNLHDYFTHGLGHGIGLEVHEKPHLRPSAKEKLLENMVFSIEPGLYMPWGGVRIEDLFTIKGGKAQILGEPARFIQIL